MTKTILVIDDDITICEIVKTILEEEGYQVKILPNGDALEKVLGFIYPDLFILDYSMPGKNGAQLAAYLRSRPDTSLKPIIMIAANPHYKRPAKKAGVNLFLNKPFDIYELINGVKNLLWIKFW